MKNLRKRTTPLPLKRGSLIHLLLETHLKGEDWEKVLADYAKKFAELMDEEKEYYGDLPNDAHRIITGYIDHYRQQEPLETLAVELSFGRSKDKIPPVEVLPGVLVKGKIDWLVKDSRGIWTAEHKTVSKQIPTESFRLFDMQTAIYTRVVQLLGYPEPAGIMFDYIRTKPPTMPKMTKQGRLSRAKIVTDYQTYMQAILDNGLNPADYREELQHAAQQQFYTRKYLPKPDYLVDHLLSDLRIVAAEMKHLANHPHRNLSRDCGYCEYEPLCTAELLNLDTEFLLHAEYIVDTGREEDEAPDGDDSEEGDEAGTSAD